MSRYKLRVALLAIAAAFLAMFASTATASAATNTPTTATAATTTVTFHGVTLTAKSKNGVTPNIIVTTNCSGRAEWFHLYTTGGTYCIGFTGTVYLSYNDSYGWCWGNNYGSLDYNYPVDGGYYDVTRIEIDGWSGHATC